MQNPYAETQVIMLGQRMSRDSPEIPNISSSEIEEMNYTINPPGLVNQLTMRIIHLQATFKVMDLISFKNQMKLKMRIGFMKLRENAC